jgi:hypothetical protein
MLESRSSHDDRKERFKGWGGKNTRKMEWGRNKKIRKEASLL